MGHHPRCAARRWGHFRGHERRVEDSDHAHGGRRSCGGCGALDAGALGRRRLGLRRDFRDRLPHRLYRQVRRRLAEGGIPRFHAARIPVARGARSPKCPGVVRKQQCLQVIDRCRVSGH